MPFRFMLTALSALLISINAAAYDAPRLAEFEAWQRNLDPAHPLGESIGSELDPLERDRYALLPGHDGFLGAEFVPIGSDAYELHYRLERGYYQVDGDYRLQGDGLRLTRLHVWLSERYFASVDASTSSETERLQLTALRYASLNRYGLMQEILMDLQSQFPGTAAARWADDFLPLIRHIRIAGNVLTRDLSAGKGDGANDLRLFGGYYGLWLGFALPLSLDADSPEPYGLGLITGGPAGYFLANHIAKTHRISEGTATMISLGGNLGTWQGLGWAGVQDAGAQNVVGTGVVCGLAGIGAAALLTSRIDFDEGHAALTESAMSWGAWFGLVAAGMANDDDDAILRKTLIGSAGLVGVTGIMARNVVMTEKQVRIINFKGIVGSVMGLGLNLLIQPDDGEVGWAIIGAGGVAGLLAGFIQGDRGPLPVQGYKPGDVSISALRFSAQPDLMNGGRSMPAVGIDINF
jgi:hypothetical protein